MEMEYRMAMEMEKKTQQGRMTLWVRKRRIFGKGRKWQRESPAGQGREKVNCKNVGSRVQSGTLGFAHRRLEFC
jgi:hypothetical protein